MGLFFKQIPINLAPISPEREKELRLFEKQRGIRFRRLYLLNLAFTHRSYSNELGNNIDNNEKLEFFGDSVLGLVISEYLYLSLPDKNEGDLARIKSFVVSEEVLAKIAKKIRVDNFILIGKGEEYSGGRKKKAILADATEAILGAYYLDSGFNKVRTFIHDLFIPEIEKVILNQHKKDYKTLLQEYVQKLYKTHPIYNIVKKSGPDHDRMFWVEVVITNTPYGVGKGKNKKEAEQQAAKIAYEKILNEKDEVKEVKKKRPKAKEQGEKKSNN
jgi:ribonuclease-3